MKENWHVKAEGDPGSHWFTFINEVLSAGKNHVRALGGNTLLSYRLSAQDSGGRAYRNQTYNLFTLTGDMALLVYDKYTPVQSNVYPVHDPSDLYSDDEDEVLVDSSRGNVESSILQQPQSSDRIIESHNVSGGGDV